jgi:hypothetical protein
MPCGPFHSSDYKTEQYAEVVWPSTQKKRSRATLAGRLWCDEEPGYRKNKYGCKNCDLPAYVSPSYRFLADLKVLLTIIAGAKGFSGSLGKAGLELGHTRDELIALYSRGIGYHDLWRTLITIRHESRHQDWHSSNENAYKVFELDEKKRADKPLVTVKRVERAVTEISK